jgi:hypothetical protein
VTGKYAANTNVPVSRSYDEIERTLKRFGATDFAYRSKADSQVNIALNWHDSPNEVNAAAGPRAVRSRFSRSHPP